MGIPGAEETLARIKAGAERNEAAARCLACDREERQMRALERIAAALERLVALNEPPRLEIVPFVLGGDGSETGPARAEEGARP